MPLISVPISDDYPVLREALVDLVADDRSLELVATARDADEAIRLANEQRPDVALLDVKMPRGGGPRAPREIRAISPAIRVVALSAYEDRVPVMEMLRAGAVGYLLKAASVGGIQRALTFSLVYPGAIKGWHRHRLMPLAATGIPPGSKGSPPWT